MKNFTLKEMLELIGLMVAIVHVLLKILTMRSKK